MQSKEDVAVAQSGTKPNLPIIGPGTVIAMIAARLRAGPIPVGLV